MPITIKVSTKTRFLENEERICVHAVVTLQEPVEVVLEILGVSRRFALSGWNVAIVGDPDFSWVMSSTQLHPKVIVHLLVTTCVLVVKPCWCRLSTKLGGQQFWCMLLRLLMALIMTLSANNPWKLFNRSMDI